MYKVTIILILSLFIAHINGQEPETSGDRMYKGKWKSVVHTISNLDSLFCFYIETNKNLEICKKTFNNLSETQQEKITTCIRYSDTRVDYIHERVKESNIEHPKRLSFVIYDKYFDMLKSGNLALELTVTTSYFEGVRYLYMLKKNGSGYSISYLVGKKDM